MALPVSDDPREGLGDGWRPNQRERQRLGRAGRAYVDRVCQQFDIAVHEGPAVLDIAAHHDAVAQLRLWQKKARTMAERLRCERLIFERVRLIDTLQQCLINASLSDATEATDDPYA